MSKPKPADLTQFVTQMKDTELMWKYFHGGNATFTLVSAKTEKRFTFKVTKSEYTYGSHKGEDIYFINVLTGPDNSNDYRCIGFIDYAGNINRPRKQRMNEQPPSYKAISWFYLQLKTGSDVALQQVEFWTSGRCCKCNRPLTVPESIQSGIGPVCAKKES